ncbi:WG repeat-containing protein [Flavobacterium longum]|uniref:WG repeat-containing protein n=1 Tax=Flavobacterium longum TaxID=1299340 RepID=UPI0039E900A0
MRNLTLAIAFLLAVPGYAQKTFPLNGRGEVTDNSLDKIIKSRGYDVVSAFDTVWKKPVLIYAEYVKDGKFGIIDHTGKEITKPIYDEIVGLNRGITPNLFAYPAHYTVKENGKYGMITRTGKVLIPSVHKYLYYRTKDSLVEVTEEGEEYTMNLKGKRVEAKPEYEEQQPQYDRRPDKVLSPDGKTYSLYDAYSRKESVVPNLGTVVQNLVDAVVFKDANGKTGLYHVRQKKLVIPFEYEEIKYGFKGYFQVKKDKKWGVMDSIGAVTIPLQYEYIGLTSAGYSAYADKKYTMYGENGKKLSDLSFDKYSYLGANGMILSVNGKYGLMGKDGKTLAPFEHDEMTVPEDHDLPFTIIVARKNGKLGVLDFSGKIWSDFTYDMVLPESLLFSDSRTMTPVFNGYANQPNRFHFVQVGQHYGIVDNEFKTIIEPTYDYFLKSPDRSVLLAKKKGKWGMIDLSEKVIIPFEYDYQPEYKDGNYQLSKDRKIGIVNRDGKPLLPFGGTRDLDSDFIYKGLWRMTDYQDRTFFFLDYAGRKSAVQQLPQRR